MRVRNHFRVSTSIIDYIISDFSLNRISNKEIYFKYCVSKRIEKLHNEYNNKLDRILSHLIKYCNYENMPLNCLSRIILSLSKITNALSKGLLSLVCKE